MKKRKTSYIVSGNVDWYCKYGEQYEVFSKKLKIELSYDPAIPLLGLYYCCFKAKSILKDKDQFIVMKDLTSNI